MEELEGLEEFEKPEKLEKIDKLASAKIIAIFIVFMILALVFMGYFVYKQSKKLNKQAEEDKQITKNEELEKEKKEKDLKKIMISGKEVIIDLNEEKNTIKENEIEEIMQKSKEKIYRFEFLEAHEYIYEKSLEFDEKTLPKEIVISLNETAYMSNLKSMLSHGHNDLAVNIVKDLEDVNNFLVSTLYLHHKDRRYIIESADSVMPIFIDEIELVKEEDITNKYKEENIKDFGGIRNIEKVYKHELLIEGNTLWSYIIKVDGKLRFIKIRQDESNDMRYSTINEIDKMLDK